MPFLIDGHNLIGRMPGLRLDDPDDERKLVDLLKGYLARARKKATVVFDRGAPAGGGGSSRALTVVFARPPRTADQVIVERLRKARNPRGLTVVTSDAEVARAAQRAGAAVKDAREFAAEVLARPAEPIDRDARLSPEEVAAWEEEFRKRRRE